MILTKYFQQNQATLYTMVLFYNKGGQVEQQSIVFISEETNHTAKEVFVFNKILNDYLQDSFPERVFQHYWSGKYVLEIDF